MVLVPGSWFPGSNYPVPRTWHQGPFYFVTDFRVVKDVGPETWHQGPFYFVTDFRVVKDLGPGTWHPKTVTGSRVLVTG